MRNESEISNKMFVCINTNAESKHGANGLEEEETVRQLALCTGSEEVQDKVNESVIDVAGRLVVVKRSRGSRILLFLVHRGGQKLQLGIVSSNEESRKKTTWEGDDGDREWKKAETRGASRREQREKNT